MCSLGRYDIPNKQKQSNFKVDLVNSNIAVFGSAMSGKTNFLKLLINCLHKRSNIYNEQIFILDFGGALRDYKDMPLVSVGILLITVSLTHLSMSHQSLVIDGLEFLHAHTRG